ncbi:hypothetical protein EMPS_09622 [Entomortierella parvispora]|uniref:Myb-like domain-containing protein n=1 Tax=Entomortierella parvispora TaxID=205924 RepID=A0A9P3HIP5_9FUNG|nr:hypothetical protein EMPS_09622 [Entomortierella parvispora]
MSVGVADATADIIPPLAQKRASVVDVVKTKVEVADDSISSKLTTNGMDLADGTETSFQSHDVPEATQLSIGNPEHSDRELSDLDRVAVESTFTTGDLPPVCEENREDTEIKELASTPKKATTMSEATTVSLSTVETIDNLAVVPALLSAKKRKWSRPTRVVKPEQSDLDAGHDGESDGDRTDSEEEQGDDEDDGDYGRTKRVASANEPAPRRSQKQAKLSEYELKRLENIRQNQEMLLQLRIPEAVSAVVESVVALKAESSTPAPVRIPRKNPVKKAPKIILPVRVSNRVRGLAVDTTVEIDENDQIQTGGSKVAGKVNSRDQSGKGSAADSLSEDEAEDAGKLMSGDLFFDEETRAKAIRVDGHYRGWLNSEVMTKYGFEGSAQEAWDANGGGSFSFKDPLGENAVRSKSGKRGPKHDAKMVAKAMFKKNPNAFFYRHNEPGQEQWTGDWTEPEKELFLKVAREHGCGDKWGLFASHIPHRVGYQCSNFYRQVVLPEGLVFDSNYEYTSRGRPIYCGKYNQRRN